MLFKIYHFRKAQTDGMHVIVFGGKCRNVDVVAQENILKNVTMEHQLVMEK